ncbi:hypothetical protein MY3296_009210 [Beauveria thailandica]
MDANCFVEATDRTPYTPYLPPCHTPLSSSHTSRDRIGLEGWLADIDTDLPPALSPFQWNTSAFALSGSYASDSVVTDGLDIILDLEVATGADSFPWCLDDRVDKEQNTLPQSTTCPSDLFVLSAQDNMQRGEDNTGANKPLDTDVLQNSGTGTINSDQQGRPAFCSPNTSSTVSSNGLPTSNKIASITLAARHVLRSDLLEYLETEVASWAERGLAEHQPGHESQVATSRGQFCDLKIAYSTVCQLHARIEYDVISSRWALINLHDEYVRACQEWHVGGSGHSIGRGDATCIIDIILQDMHQDWLQLKETQRKAMRARFHDRKRYGKRWAMVANTLGKGFLLVCSARVANMV